MSSYKYSVNKYWGTVYGDYFKKFKGLIKNYCLSYNVYPVNTTIEGTLVNSNNIELFREWLNNRHQYDQINISNLYNISKNTDDVTSAFRLIVHGKYDTLKKLRTQR